MVETERLTLYPLAYNQLVRYISVDHSLEAELKLNESSRTVSPELKEALERTILPNVADTTKNYLYSTLWTVVSKADSRMVGDLCFIGEPDADGEVEIGYGTYDEFRGRGYMTEAVGGMLRWAESQPNVASVKASTEKENAASIRILEKNGFVRVGDNGTLLDWRLIFSEK